MTKPQYEYTFLKVYPFSDPPMGLPNLNDLGYEGWQVINAGYAKLEDGSCMWELLLARRVRRSVQIK